ncbi:MAG TPA: hypothetical protein VN673_16620, partial [Clostridia bacterium]|nr:hypothetical protein [Clostridia bacterium]
MRVNLGAWRSLTCSAVGVRLLISSNCVLGQGLPEPDFVQYGVVRNVTSNANVALVYGTLTWVFVPVGGGSQITTAVTLTNLNKQYCYLMRMRCESEVGGLVASSNALKLAATPTAYNRSLVTWNGQPMTFVQPTLTTLTLSAADRGRVERVDLDVAAPYGDSDNNGLIDDWERFYFGRVGVDPDEDDDHDGMSNAAESAAGTDPTDGSSALRFIRITKHAQGGYLLEWQSATNRMYALQQTAELGGAFADVRTAIASTPPVNTFWDSNAPSIGPT